MVIHTVKGFGIVNKAEVDVFLELSSFFWWSSGCWQFDLWFLCLFWILLEHLEVLGSHTAEFWLEEFWALLCQHWKWVQLCGSLNILWYWPSLGMEWKTDFFHSCCHCWVFQICWYLGCSIFTASSFRIWKSSAGIPTPPLASFLVMLLRPTWLHIPGCLAVDEWSYDHGYLDHSSFWCSSSV